MTIRWALLVLTLATAGSAAAEVRMENGWVRAVPPVSDSTAGYARIINDGGKAVSIAAADVDWAGGASLHEVAAGADGTRTMRPVGPVELAPGEPLVLQPGGKHLMFTAVERVPGAGERVSVCLRVNGERQCTELAVRRSAPE